MAANLDKMVYKFGEGIAEGDKSMKAHLGGKGANLAEMCSFGLPVPPGFTISTDTCKFYSENDHQWPEGLDAQVREGIDHIAAQMGAGLVTPRTRCSFPFVPVLRYPCRA